MSNSANSLRFFMWIFLCHLFYKAKPSIGGASASSPKQFEGQLPMNVPVDQSS